MANLSKRAEKLLARVKKGEWYPAYSDRIPKSMHELEDARLVKVTGRYPMIIAAYVPTTGYTPHVEERFGPKKYTVFICAANGTGTTYVTGAEAETSEEAKEICLSECAADWETEVEYLHVLGVAEGDVNILEWDDVGV